MPKEDIDRLVGQLRTILLNKPLSKEDRVEDPELATLQEAIFYLGDCLKEANEFMRHLQKKGNWTRHPLGGTIFWPEA